MKSPYFDKLRAEMTKLGGYHNAHIHLDRANTLDDGFVDHGNLQVLESSHISLQKKHALIATVHAGPAYTAESLRARAAATLDVMVDVGTRRVDTMVDVTDDNVQLSALETIQSIAAEYAGKIDLRAAAYTPLGFRNDMPGRWDVFERGAQKADFIGCLPEADDVNDYPHNIGFEEHCVRMLDLARRTGKMLHVHTDQLNIPQEDGTERLIEVIRREGGALSMPDGTPQVWAVHMISPSTYEPWRWERFVAGLLECNIGVISCPSAAVGMRQLRALHIPIYNSIPRILELAAAGVPIRLGSDNIADMCSPSTTADLTEEVFVLSAAVRFYKTEILAKFAAGVPLDAEDRDILTQHLGQNDEEIDKLVRRWAPQVTDKAAASV